jgi:hypothetical protein
MTELNEQQENRAQRPLKNPTTPQQYYDFISQPLMYEFETEEEFAERKQLLEQVDKELDIIEEQERQRFRKNFTDQTLIGKLMKRIEK